MQILQVSKLKKYTGLPAIIIGNSPSRHSINIENLKGKGIIFGCNRLCQDINFQGYPFFLGACDDSIYELLGPMKEWRENHNIILYHNPPNDVLKAFDVSYIHYDIMELWKNTGHAMVQVAIHLECSPIYLLGFFNIAKNSKGQIVENMYEHDIRKKGFRISPRVDHCEGLINNFEKSILDIDKKIPGLLVEVQVPGYRSRLSKIIQLSDFLESLRLDLRSEVTSVNGFRLHV